MTAAKFTLTSTILAAALGLVLGLATPSVQAHHDPDHNKGGGGGGSGGEDATLFAVTLKFLISSSPPSMVLDCDGTTDIQANPGLSADFFSGQGCTVSVAIEEFGLGPVLFLSPFRVEVRTKKSGTDLRLYFTTQTDWSPHTDPLQNETIYVTDFLSAYITFNTTLSNDFFIMPIGASDLALTKIHQPGKRAETMETISFGPFHYRPE